ncbi:MAG: hypothetical protein CVU80_01090 [Elusimicrobia bacterium HGW-Elusimicrobia-4]|nr:MAG: hypothetical protein CVU80_01090 [Elusimicrobia bacterium HGW-Elusimicrobia-4]
MTGLKKIILSFFLIIISLIIIFTVVRKFVFPPKLLKNYVQGRIPYISGAKTELRDISVGLSGINLIDIAIFLPDVFELKIEKTIISPNLFSFPRKQVAFNGIKIIKPKIKIEKNFKNFKIKKNILRSGYTLVFNRLKIEDGSFYCGKLEIFDIQIDIKSASINGVFPIEVFFNMKDVGAYIDAEYDFKKQYLKIKNAVFKSDKKNVIISGSIKKLVNPDEAKFDVSVKGSGELFNKIFPSNLRHKKKIIIFDKGNINLKIHGNLDSFQVVNLQGGDVK